MDAGLEHPADFTGLQGSRLYATADEGCEWLPKREGVLVYLVTIVDDCHPLAMAAERSLQSNGDHANQAK